MLLTLIILFTFFGSIVSLAGGFLLLLKQRWTKEFSTKLVSFSAGVLIATAFFDLFPEALSEAKGKDIFLSAFLAILSFFFLERFLFWFHHHHDAHGIKPSIYLITIGDTIHNFIDGVAIAATFLVNIPLGITTSIAVFAHEVPQEIADFSIMIEGGLSKRKTLFINLISAAASLLGALLAFHFSSFLKDRLYIIIAFTAGMFTYISAADLIPELHREFEKRQNWQQTVYFLIGIATIIALGAAIGS